jgi:hypothetical protein
MVISDLPAAYYRNLKHGFPFSGSFHNEEACFLQWEFAVSIQDVS